MFLTADAGLDFGVVAEVIDKEQVAGIEALSLVTSDIRASAL
jgi:biopolymer transport protein ExbD